MTGAVTTTLTTILGLAPVPVFELSANLEENLSDLKAVLQGDFGRIIIPEGNSLDVNWRELQHAFPGHAMFENGAELL